MEQTRKAVHTVNLFIHLFHVNQVQVLLRRVDTSHEEEPSSPSSPEFIRDRREAEGRTRVQSMTVRVYDADVWSQIHTFWLHPR